MTDTMTEEQWERLDEEAQTEHCRAMARLWIAAAFRALTGGGKTVVSGSHIHYREEELQ